MPHDPPLRRPYDLPAIGLTLRLDARWPVLPMPAGQGEGIYQPVADTSGVFFARYGAHARLEPYLAGLGDALTTAAILDDAPVRVSGHPARRVVVELREPPLRRVLVDPGRGPAEQAARRTRIVVVGLERAGTPVLLGYRLPEALRPEHEAALARALDEATFDANDYRPPGGHTP